MTDVNAALKEIEAIVGKDYVTDKDFMKAAYSRNVDSAFPDRWADIIVRPGTTEEVSAIVRVANKYKLKMVPRGGGADLVGGSVTQGGILFDLTRMNQIFEINKNDMYCVVGCGITWGELVSKLHEQGVTTGLVGPGSGYSATIGGGLSNSTAGYGSTKYGLVPDICNGVEVVLCDPKGTIIRTGAAGNKYAKPFCRYGVSPDFTGLFMGDVGTMGIKTKAFLRLSPLAPFKAWRNYMLLKNDYNKVYEILKELRYKIGDGLTDVFVVPYPTLILNAAKAKQPPPKRPRFTGSVFMIFLEAVDQRILDVYLELLAKLMEGVARPFEMTEYDLEERTTAGWKFDLSLVFNYFNFVISPIADFISNVTCHKIPISFIKDGEMLSHAFDAKFGKELPDKGLSLFATVIYLVPNGNCVFVGGITGHNTVDQQPIAMKIWHKKLRAQVRYGGCHYWLGESISQSIVEAGAYTPEFAKFFKDVKKVVDPNFLLSPNKFHMHAYEDDISKYVVDPETEKYHD